MKYKCIDCKIILDRDKLKRINREWICNDCHRKKIKNKRDTILHDVAGVRRREDILKEAQEKREKELLSFPKINILPNINGGKERKKEYSPKFNKTGLYITKEEKGVIINKFGNYDNSKDRINNLVSFQKEIRTNLKQKEIESKKENSEELNKNFIEGLKQKV